ncbi:MAG: hypothetical protein CVU10_01360 [Bacteroidetes bacterium HGW-Bacteroidetes-5]|nr:MAG: hypothetical protein CVU10_01360 [Bacteroidetes bacterium HGW-Bacteroidetes-5]
MVFIAFLPIGAYLALQMPALQTWSARKAAKSLSKRLNTEVSIGKVYYIFFNKLIINDITILSSPKDTLLDCGKVSVTLSAKDIIKGNFRFGHIHLYDGILNLVNETDSTTNLSRIIKGFSSKSVSDSTKLEPDIYAHEFKLENFRFNMLNPFSQVKEIDPQVINFSDLSLSNINLEIKRITFHNDTLKADIKNISFLEKSGFRTNRFSANLSLSSKIIDLKNLIVEDGYSELNAERFSMYFENFSAFSDFLNSVKMELKLNSSLLNLKTVSKFDKSLANNNLTLNVTGQINGSVSNLKTENLMVSSESGLTYADINARISGLPDSDQTMLFVDINSATTTSLDLAYIISSLNSTKPIEFLTNLSPFIKYNFKGRLAGLLDDFVANGNLTSNIGDIYMDVLIRRNNRRNGLDLIGNLRSEQLNIGKLINNSSVGRITLNTRVNALLRESGAGGSEFKIDSLFIREFEFNNYPYRNIAAVGSYLNNTFDGKVICRDPNLDLIFQGIIGINLKSVSYYDFYADVIYADLAALNFDKRDSLSGVSLKMLANFTQSNKGEIDGTINIKGLNFTNSNGKFPIGDISVQSNSSQDKFNIYLRSAFANATYRGDDFITNFIDKFSNITLHSNLKAIFPVSRGDFSSGNNKRYSFNIEFNDTKSISQLVMPGLNIASGTSLKIDIDPQENVLLDLKSDRIGYKNTYSNKLALQVKGNTKELTSRITSNRLHLAGFNLDSSIVSMTLKENLLNIKSEYKNQGEFKNRMDFTSSVLFTSLGEGDDYITDISIDPSEIFLNGERWNFAKSKIVKQDSTYVFHEFRLFQQNQYLNIDGIISSNPFDTLSVNIKDIDISPLNNLIKEDLNIKGRFTGNALAINLYKEPKILLNITGREIEINNSPLGELDIISEWDNNSEHFNLRLSNRLSQREPLNITGTYKPKGNYLIADVLFDTFSPAYFEPFLTGIISNSKGGISGSVRAEGPLDKLNLSGRNTYVNNLSLKIDFTNVIYTLNGPFSITEKGVTFNNIAIKDRLGNIGRVSGGLSYNYFKNLALNTIINFTNMEALNTKEEDNTDFYGNAFGTGRLSISGPLQKILIDISVTANKNTSIHIPLTSATEVSSKNLLTFTQAASELYNKDGVIIEQQEAKSSTELQVKLRANMTPDAAMLIEIDKSVGDIITGYGSGLITIDINPSRDIFSITGDYIIQSGSYKFVLQGFIERDFTVQEGGSIGFNGDIMKTNLNLTANYKTKASVNTLIADTSSVANRRTVDCQINMSGPLMNPRLSFAIDIPDIDPITKSRVNAALNTDDKVIKQVMSLLVSGSFIPDVQSSIVNNSTILYSNATEVLSNQINKIFNQLDIPLDLSFNYQPGQNGRDIFDAAVSAQLFNNRVVVNGNIGSSKYLNKSSGVVGDLDVEIKLDERGRFRAKAFSHSADQYSNYLDNTQRNGVGLVYQEEFRSFKELINSFFISRKRRERILERSAAIKMPEEIAVELRD